MLRFASMDCRKSFTRITGRPLPAGLARPEPLIRCDGVRLGIGGGTERPASPQDNGRHERMHRTLKQDTLSPPARDPKRQQEAFRVWQKRYNEDRPHESLGYQSPASCYARSPREFPRRVPEVEYDSGVLVRRVMKKASCIGRGRKSLSVRSFGGNRLDSEPRTTAITKFFTGLW